MPPRTPTESLTTARGFRATRVGNELVVHDVPIFCECSRKLPDGEEFHFDADWIASAVSEAKTLEKGNYLPPLHVRHHEPSTDANDSVRAAGVFRITGNRKSSHKGKQVQTVYADLIFRDPEVIDEVLNKRFPYRSVEIFNINNPALNGLALLDHEAPFLELPMLEIVDPGAIPNRIAGATSPIAINNRARSVGTLYAFFSRAESAASVIFREDDMKPEDEYQDDDMKADSDDAVLMDEITPEPEPVAEPEPSEDKSLETAWLAIEALKEAVALIRTQFEMGNQEPQQQPMDQIAPAASPAGFESMKADTTYATKFAQLQAELDGLKAENARIKAKQDRKLAVDSALERVEGLPVGDLGEELSKFHEEHGPTAFKAYADARVRLILQAHQKPAISDDGDASGADIPDVAMKFSRHGAAAVERAAYFAREWQEQRDMGLKTPLESYVVRSMANDGIKLGV